ncbi:MAG: TRL domain-containing protein [Deltaproteobacteria bacterium]|jgi:hypothetical protein
MKKVLAFVAVAAFLVVVGCAAGPSGVLFTSVKHPGSFQTGLTTNPGGSAISGESCSMSILGAIALGDWSIDAALKAAGAEGKTLKNVAVDHPTLNILGLYGKYCTTVAAQVAQ